MRSFALTHIRDFKFGGDRKGSNITKYHPFSKHYSLIYPCSNFFKELRYAVSRATNEISMYSLELNSREFIQLVKAAKKANALIFKNCKILSDSKFDFWPMEGCLIERIEIDYLKQVYNKKSEYEECLMQIFRGILNCKNLIWSLKHLSFKCTQDLINKMTKKAKEKFGGKYSEIMPYLKSL